VADSGNIDQSAHIRHTKKVAEIKALIGVMEALRVRLEQERAACGTRPVHQPSINHEGKSLLLDMGLHPPRPIPGSEEAAAQQVAAENDFLAVTSPFSTVWWPPSNEDASKTQREMLAWRRDFDKAMERSRDYCARYVSKEVLARFQNADADLRRHVELLIQELDDLDSRESLLFHLEQDPASALRAARGHHPKHTRDQAAKAMAVDPETVKAWETKKRRPSGENELDVRAYVLSRNGFSI